MFFKLLKILKGCKVKRNDSLKKLSTIKIGGKAKYLVFPKTCEQIVDLVLFLNEKNIKFLIVGNASNILFKDEMFDGVVICLKQFNEIRRYGNDLQINAGTMISEVANFCNNCGLGGMEDAMGIPATMGGAVCINASAYNYETKNVVSGVLFLRDNKINYFFNDECDFSYRHSAFKNGDVVLRVDLSLKSNDVLMLKKRSAQVLNMRTKLPKLPSLGSIFKRNDNVIVSKLIDQMGLKGLRVNDAMVSYEHAGVIINLNNATSKDVKLLIEKIKKEVLTKQKIELEEEIKIL